MSKTKEAQTSAKGAQSAKTQVNNSAEELTLDQILALPLVERIPLLIAFQDKTATEKLAKIGGRSVGGFTVSKFMGLPIIRAIYRATLSAKFPLINLRDLAKVEDSYAIRTLAKEVNTSPAKLKSYALENEAKGTDNKTDLTLAYSVNEQFCNDLERGHYGGEETFAPMEEALKTFKESKAYTSIEEVKDKAHAQIKFRSEYIDANYLDLLNSAEYKVSFFVNEIKEEFSYKYINNKGAESIYTTKGYNELSLTGGFKAIELICKVRGFELQTA